MADAAQRSFEAFGQRIDVEVREGANEGAPTVVFVHALAGDRALLEECCDAACAGRGLRRLYLDLPGHGGSTGNRDAASADHLAAALAALVSERCPRAPLLVGYSYGAYLAQALTTEIDAAGLFLACPVVEPELPRRARPPRRVARRDPALVFVDEHEQATFEEVAVVQTQAVLERYRRLVMPASREADRAFVDGVRARYLVSRPFAAALAAFERPVEIVCGRQDHWVGFEDQARLARLFPDAALTVLAGCGQLLPIEAPERFAPIFDAWLARAAAAAVPVPVPVPVPVKDQP